MEHRGTSWEMHTRTVFRTFVIYPDIRMTIVDVTTCCWFYIYYIIFFITFVNIEFGQCLRCVS